MIASLKIISKEKIMIRHNDYINHTKDEDFNILINASNDSELRGKLIFFLSKLKIFDIDKVYDDKNSEFTSAVETKLLIYEVLNKLANNENLNLTLGEDIGIEIKIINDK